MPSWGIFARHVANLRVRGVELRTITPDARPAVVLDDVRGGALSEVALGVAGGEPRWSLRTVAGVRVRDVAGLPEGDLAVP